MSSARPEFRHDTAFVGVSTLAEQFYCEYKVENEFALGEIPTEAKETGTELHDELIPGVEIPAKDFARLVSGKRPSYAVLRVWGTVGGLRVVGMPDHIVWSEGRPLWLVELKTTKGDPKPLWEDQANQVRIYGLLLDSMGFDCSKLRLALVRLGPKLISNDLARLWHPPMSLLSRRKVPQLDQTQSGRPFHRGRKFMYRLTGKAIRFIKNTRLDLLDAHGLSSVAINDYAQTIYRDYPIELRSYIDLPAEYLGLASPERKFPKPKKEKQVAGMPSQSGSAIATPELLRAAMLDNELRNLRDGTQKVPVHPQIQATQSEASAADLIRKLENDIREFEKTRTSRVGMKKAEPPQGDLQRDPSGQLLVSLEFVSLLLTQLTQLRIRIEELKMAEGAQAQSPSNTLLKKQELEAEGYIVEYPKPVWALADEALKNLKETSKRQSEEAAKKQKSEDDLLEGLELFQPLMEAVIQEGVAYLTKPKADTKLAKDKGSPTSTSQEAPNPDEDELIRRTQLLLVREVVKPRSRITLDEASAKLGVPPEQLMPILPQIVEGLDLVLDEYDDSFSVRHRSRKYRGMPEKERPPP